MFKGWKKVSTEKNHTVMRNKDGHEFKIAHNALSPKLRGQLAEIPVFKEEKKMADGGNVDKGWSQKDKADFSKGASESGDQGSMENVKNSVKGLFGMYKGGDIDKGFSQKDKEDFSRGASSLGSLGDSTSTNKPANTLKSTPNPYPHKDTKLPADINYREKEPSSEDKEAAEAKTDAESTPVDFRRQKPGMARGGQVQYLNKDGEVLPPDLLPQPTPVEKVPDIIEGVPASASDPNTYDFEQKVGEERRNLAVTSPNLANTNAEAQKRIFQQMDAEAAQKHAANAAQAQSADNAFKDAQGLNDQRIAHGISPTALPPKVDMSPVNAAPKSPEAPVPTSTPTGATPPTTGAGNASLDPWQQQIAGVTQEAKAQRGLANDQQAIYKKQQDDFAKVNTDIQSQSDTLKNDFDAATSAVKNAEIDPNRFWHNQNVPSGILNMIGLIAGGIGSGISGGPNVAQVMINKQIDNDIEAQKANMHNKQNLLGELHQHYGDIQVASNVAKGLLQEQTIEKLNAAAAKASDPIIKARLQQNIAGIRQQQYSMMLPTAKLMSAMNIRQAVMNNPEHSQEYIDQLRLLDPKGAEELQQRSTPMGIASSPSSATAFKKTYETISTGKDTIRKLQELSNKPDSAWNPADRQKAATIMGAGVGDLRAMMTSSGRVSKESNQMMEDMIKNPTKIFSIAAKNKASLDAMSGVLDGRLQSAAVAHGIKLQDPMTRLSPAEKQIYDYSKNNPSNPKSQYNLDILNKKMGIR